MATVAINAFRGEIPRLSPRLLPNSHAKHATNMRITAGRMDPIKGAQLLHTSSLPVIKSMYRYEVDGAPHWLLWGEVVDTIKSPFKEDTFSRIYFSGEHGPRMTTAALAISGGGEYPGAWFTLGVTAPKAGATLTPPAGGTQETRSYVFRFVTQYGEASGIVDRGTSNAINGTGDQAGTWAFTTLPAPPANSGSITSASVSGNVVTVVLTGSDQTYGMDVGDWLNIAGTTGMTGLNGLHRVTKIVSATSFQIKLATTGTAAGGTWTRESPHNLTSLKRQIFRTVGTNADWHFVAEIPATDATYSDAVASTALGEVIDSAEALPPPKASTKIAALANGCIALLDGNQICLSDPDMPHAFPVRNRYAVPGAVAIAAVRNTVIVLTDSYPILVVAEVPEAASRAPMGQYAPCRSDRAVIRTDEGVVYAAHDGFYRATVAGAQLITGNIWRSPEWRAMVPETMVAAQSDQQLVMSYENELGRRMVMLDLYEPDSVVHITDYADALHMSELDGLMYTAKAESIYNFDADDANRLMSSFTSKDFQAASPQNFGAAQVHADYSDLVVQGSNVEAENLLLLADALNITGSYGDFEYASVEPAGSNLSVKPDAIKRSVQFTLMRKGAPFWSRQVTDSNAFKLPSGFKDELVGIEVSASIPVFSVSMAGTMNELAQGPQ